MGAETPHKHGSIRHEYPKEMENTIIRRYRRAFRDNHGHFPVVRKAGNGLYYILTKRGGQELGPFTRKDLVLMADELETKR